MNINGGEITTTELINGLRSLMQPSGEDIEILSGRKDDKFSQKVRNLRAHKTLERVGYAKYKQAKNSPAVINKNGREYLKQNQTVLKYLLSNGFLYSDVVKSLKDISSIDRKRKVEAFEEGVFEGNVLSVETKVYKRSAKLRNLAIEYFTKNGLISCRCCNFDYKKYYGSIGEGFIEIHHLKPIYKYKDEDMKKVIDKALNNLLPVCANCHRMIHRKKVTPLSEKELVSAIKNHGICQMVNYSENT